DFPSVGVLSSHFFRSDSSKMAIGTETWIQKSNALEKNLLFIPLNTKNIHWSLLVIDLQNKIVAHLDSLADKSATKQKRVQNCIDEIMNLLSKSDTVNREDWKIKCSCPCPKQTNGYDCGVFVCYFMHF